MDVLRSLEDCSYYKTYLRDYPTITLNHQNILTFINVGKLVNTLHHYAKLIGTDKQSNGHYITCIWSEPETQEGPDTCLCCLIGSTHYRLKNLLSELYHVKHNSIDGEEKKR